MKTHQQAMCVQNRGGFTLVEIGIVLAVVGLLVLYGASGPCRVCPIIHARGGQVQADGLSRIIAYSVAADRLTVTEGQATIYNLDQNALAVRRSVTPASAAPVLAVLRGIPSLAGGQFDSADPLYYTFDGKTLKFLAGVRPKLHGFWIFSWVERDESAPTGAEPPVNHT